MNVLVLTNMYPSKAKPTSGLFVLNQIEALKKLGVEIELIYKKRVFGSKVKIIFSYFIFFMSLFGHFVKGKYKSLSIIHVHFYYPTIYFALLIKFLFARKAKLICTFHGSDVYGKKNNIFYRWPLRFVDSNIFVSNGLRDKVSDIEPMLKEEHIIPAGISELFRPNSSKIIYDFCYIGSFYEIKGFDRLCEYLEKTSGFKIAICGSGKLENLISSNILAQHDVDLFGDVQQVGLVEIYSSSRFLINVSRNESFGLTIAEAMASGTPVIATETDGAQEQIINGVNGFLLKNNKLDTLLLTSLLQRFNNQYSSEYTQLKLNSLETSNKYKLDSISRRVLTIYKDLS